MDPVFETIKERAAAVGLNLVGALPATRYDAAVSPGASQFAPDARSIVVLGNGGRQFWESYSRHVAAHPGWERRADPLDDFTQTVVDELADVVRQMGGACTVVYPFVNQPRLLRFMELGRLAGLGAPSFLGILIHPVYGPWIALRAALFIDREVDAPERAVGFDPCPKCEARTCISACPVGAVSAAAGWNVYQCTEHRVRDELDCGAQCHARRACVLAPEYRYADDELRYHQERSLTVMRAWYAKRARP